MNHSPFLSYFLGADCLPHATRLLHPEPGAKRMTQILEDFTSCYKRFDPREIELREAACMRVQLSARVRPVQGEDLFAGRLVQSPIGFTPQSKGTGMGYCIHPEIDNMLASKKELSKESREKLAEIMGFWQEEGTVYKSRRKMPREVRDALPSELYYQEPGIAFTLYRMSGIQLDYRKLLDLGIPGLRKEVAAYREKAGEGNPSHGFYRGLEQMLDTFCELATFYSLHCQAQAEQCTDPDRRSELETMSGILLHIQDRKPESFREGLQLLYLYNIFDGAKNYGRMDDSLGDLCTADLEKGHIDDDEAIRLLSSIWKLMLSRDNRYDTRLIIGGRGRRNETNANRLALLILETTRRVKENVPQLALRFHRDQDTALYQKGMDLLSEGNTYPMLYNDEVNVPAAMQAFRVSEEEAVHVIQFGCGEYVLDHRSVGTPSGVINLLQALLVTLNRGKDPGSRKFMGMPLERYLKYGNFERFEDLMGAYMEQVEYHVGPLALQEYLEYRHAAEDNAYLSSSLLMDDCLLRGKGIFDGGIRHLGGTLETYGNSNTADSLVAIRELVYERKLFTLDELIQILQANFEGFGKARRMMLNCPKYGNDHELADEMYVRVHKHICKLSMEQATKVGLDSYLVVVINNDANTVMGTFTAASPDGRKAYTYLNPGNNPVGGADRKGVTACMNSLVKPSTAIHAGAVQNMKFSKDLLRVHRPHLEALLKAYFLKGGAQLMLNVLDRGELEDAQKHPEQHQNLIVRVGGFSERFVNLPRETQDEILSRTLH